MNIREAMQALLDGKKLTAATLTRPGYLCLDTEGGLRWSDGRDAALSTRHNWLVYEEPNPHKTGTFNWAREEAKRGKTVCRACFNRIRFTADNFQPSRAWAIEHIDATDWMVAP